MLVLVCSMAVTASSSRINPISPLRIKFGNASLGPYKVDFYKKVFDGQQKENFGRIERTSQSRAYLPMLMSETIEETV